jgi:hypothetical protein
MGTASKTKEDPVKGRSGAHALLSGSSKGGQELIMTSRNHMMVSRSGWVRRPWSGDT